MTSEPTWSGVCGATTGYALVEVTQYGSPHRQFMRDGKPCDWLDLTAGEREYIAWLSAPSLIEARQRQEAKP